MRVMNGVGSAPNAGCGSGIQLPSTRSAVAMGAGVSMTRPA